MLLHISDVEQFILYFLWHHRCTSDLAGCRVCIKMRGKTPKHSPSSPSSSSAVSLWPNIRLKSRLAGASQGYHRNWVFAWHEKILPSNYPPTMFAGAFFFFLSCLFLSIHFPALLAPSNLLSSAFEADCGKVWIERQGAQWPNYMASLLHATLFFI